MQKEAPILNIKNLCISLKGPQAKTLVSDVNLHVMPNEIVCIVGESGSGKSLTAQSIMGLLPKSSLHITGGSIELEGEALLSKSADDIRDICGKRVAMVFQEPMTALNPVEKVGAQIEEFLSIHTKLNAAERRARALEMMHLVQLPNPETMIDAYPHQLSGGQRQRILIAGALILDPALLIADEPTTALDVTTQAQVLKLFRELQQRRRTGVLFITHDFGVVSEIADRVIVMQKGKIVEQGTRDEILYRPREAYTQMLIASVPSITPPKRAPVEGEILLKTQNLEKSFGKRGFFTPNARITKAVNNVSIEIRRGETLGIVGESGSGKSTVARCIARLIDPTSGNVEISGVDIGKMAQNELRNMRKEVQVVFQDPFRSLNPRRTVGESIIEGPMNFGMPQRDAWKRAQDLMRYIGLPPEALTRYPHQFSGGQRQRISIARALAMEPQLLIGDEPVSALDVSVQAQVLQLLDDSRKKYNLAMLFITHDLRVAAQICDRIAVMQKGVVVESGMVADVFANPQHEYTRALFAAAPGKDVAFYKAPSPPL